MIPALIFVSVSELQVINPKVTSEDLRQNTEKLYKYLYALGINTNGSVELQANITHRNRLNQIVTCDRYLGFERLDKSWLTSGYASREAIDKASNSKLLEDLYKRKGYVT